MPKPKDEYKGIMCMNPDCDVVNDVKCGQMKKSQDYITRPKTCKNCGTVYNTVEVPVCIVEIHNNHLGNAGPAAKTAAPVVEAPAVVAPLPETPPAAVAALVTEAAPPAVVASVEALAVAGTTVPPPPVALT